MRECIAPVSLKEPRLGPCTVPRIKCQECGTDHHIDAASGEYQGRCRNCSGFLRRPTDKEKRRFYDFMEWKHRYTSAEDSDAGE
jgi:hypothetical protein